MAERLETALAVSQLKAGEEQVTEVVLQRIDRYAGGTIGKLFVDGRFACFTVELPWKGNRQNVSCIPAGEYDLKWCQSRRFGRCLEVMSVRNRSGILFHAANLQSECKGCIFPATSVGRSDAGYYGCKSQDALQKFERMLPTDSRYCLLVRNPRSNIQKLEQ